MHGNQKVVERCRKAGAPQDALEEMQKLDGEIDAVMKAGDPSKGKGLQAKFQELALEHDPWERS